MYQFLHINNLLPDTKGLGNCFLAYARDDAIQIGREILVIQPVKIQLSIRGCCLILAFAIYVPLFEDISTHFYHGPICSAVCIDDLS